MPGKSAPLEKLVSRLSFDRKTEGKCLVTSFANLCTRANPSTKDPLRGTRSSPRQKKESVRFKTPPANDTGN